MKLCHHAALLFGLIFSAGAQQWPAAFGCEMNLLGYRMAQWLQPERNWSSSSGRAIAEGLNLKVSDPLSSCGSTLNSEVAFSTSPPLDPKPTKLRQNWRAGVPLPHAAAVSSTVFVDSTIGSDQSPGTQQLPLKTISAAVARVPSLAPPRSVVLRGGVHHIAATLELTPEHSNTTFVAAAGEHAVLSAGRELRLAWAKSGSSAKGAEIYRASLPPGMPNFLELFNRSGERLIPAREPDGNPEADRSNYQLNAAGWLPNRRFGKATIVANASWTRPGALASPHAWSSYAVGVGGPAENFDPPVSMWADETIARGAGGGALYSIPSGLLMAPPAAGSPQMNTSTGVDGFVFMMQTHGWGSWVYEINATHVYSNGSVEVRFGRGGQQEARGNGGSGGGSFYVSHRHEFLDSPNEWYLDRQQLVLYVAVAPGVLPPSSLVAPLADELVRVKGKQDAPVIGIRMSGLSFRHASPTYMHSYTAPSGGDYAVHRGGAVHFNGTVDCMVDHCLFDAVGGNAIWLTDFNRRAHIVSNEMRNLGEIGVGMTGSTEWVDGRNGDQPRSNTIEGNLIHHFGLYTKQSCAIFSAVACQNTISSNILFHGPRALINMNDGFGGDTVINRNLFFGSMRETSDHGPYNSWDRLPFITTVRNGTPSLVPAFNRLSHNLFFSGGGEAPFSIDTDDGSNHVNATSNVLLASALWKTDFGGHTKVYSKNVVFCAGSPGWSHCGGQAEMDDASNVFSYNRLVGQFSNYVCANGTDPCPAPRFGGPAGNSTNCPVVKGNEYYNFGTEVSEVCRGGSRVEQGSKNLPFPTLSGLLDMAREALGMPLAHHRKSIYV